MVSITLLHKDSNFQLKHQSPIFLINTETDLNKYTFLQHQSENFEWSRLLLYEWIRWERESIGRANLAELGLELSVNLIESTTEVRELSSSLIGHKDLRHPFPINRPWSFERHIRYFLTGSAHFFLFTLMKCLRWGGGGRRCKRRRPIRPMNGMP